MPKKTSPSRSVLTPRESLRRHSLTLERHLYRKQQTRISRTFQQHANAISFSTYELGTDLIREVNHQAQIKFHHHQQHFDADSEEIRRQIRQKQRLPTVFEEKLQHSEPSYERCSEIFRGASLREKYRHLIDPDSEEQKTNAEPSDLQEAQKAALGKVRELYRKYRVSNMYKKHVCQKICRKYVERLIKKGLIREHKTILSLIC